MVRILSHLRVFELKKLSHLKALTWDGYFELKSKRNVKSKLHPRANTSSNDFLSHLKDLRVYPHIMELKIIWIADVDINIKPIRNQDLFNNVDLYNSNLDLFNADNDVDAGYPTDFVFDGSRNEYYPIEITKGLNYNSL